MRILGIDPGSVMAGYGCIDFDGNEIIPLAHGTFRLMSRRSASKKEKNREIRNPGMEGMGSRLRILFEDLTAVISGYHPDIVAVEKVFVSKNVSSALKLGQSRGVVLLSAALNDIETVEYSPTQIKQALVGSGRADKAQVAKMVQLLTGARKFESNDASDALALAICHAHHTRASSRFGSGAFGSRRKKSIKNALGY